MGFLSENYGVFIRFSAQMHIAEQVIIRPCERNSSTHEASLSSNLGNIGRQPCAAFYLLSYLMQARRYQEKV